MPHSTIEDASGLGSLVTGAVLFIVDYIKLAQVNDILITLTTLGGLIWMIFKIVSQRLDNKIKRRELEKDIENTR